MISAIIIIRQRSPSFADHRGFTSAFPPQARQSKNQRRELTAVAKRHGWRIFETFKDQGSAAPKVADPPMIDFAAA